MLADLWRSQQFRRRLLPNVQPYNSHTFWGRHTYSRMYSSIIVYAQFVVDAFSTIFLLGFLLQSTITNWCLIFITIFVELDAVLKSLPTSRSGEHSSLHIVRKRLNKHKVFDRGQQWNAETQTLLELIILASISYIGFISYMLFKGQRR